MEPKLTVRQTLFCAMCKKRLLVRTHDDQWSIPVVSIKNNRSGCCYSYVASVIEVVGSEQAFLPSDAPGFPYRGRIEPEFSLAGPVSTIPRAVILEGKKLEEKKMPNAKPKKKK